jgi:glutamate formiminotransferase/formiminotetrahydrofolate cyclodeaminase
MTTPILECVPNFSEGRDPQKIAAIADAIRSTAGAALLHIDTSPAANRTVITFAGAPQAVTDAAFAGIKKAAEVIDMTAQDGVHPRIGATDVCPLVPLEGMTVKEADYYARQLGQRVGNELGIPVYLYEHSAEMSHRRALPDIRKGQYEGFAKKIKQPDWAPDFGPLIFTPKSGATVVGVRDVLVAFNISLNMSDINLATQIAQRLRTRGMSFNGVKIPGLLPKTRAIGWYMADYGQAQVSINLLDYRVASPLQAFEACRVLAEELGTTVTGSEVIGLIPEECLLEAGTFALMKSGMNRDMDDELKIHQAIRYLGLANLKPFEPQEKILEYVLRHHSITS